MQTRQEAHRYAVASRSWDWKCLRYFDTVMKHGRGMGNDSDSTGHTEARAMIDIFASVGATRFEVTWTNANGDPRKYEKSVSLVDLKRRLPAILDGATANQRNIIVRPHGDGVTFIQLDDLKADQLARVAPAVFLTLEGFARKFSGRAGCDAGAAEGQGFCAPVQERRRRRRDRERRNARRWQPQFQGQVRAEFSACDDARSQPRTAGGGGRA